MHALSLHPSSDVPHLPLEAQQLKPWRARASGSVKNERPRHTRKSQVAFGLGVALGINTWASSLYKSIFCHDLFFYPSQALEMLIIWLRGTWWGRLPQKKLWRMGYEPLAIGHLLCVSFLVLNYFSQCTFYFVCMFLCISLCRVYWSPSQYMHIGLPEWSPSKPRSLVWICSSKGCAQKRVKAMWL